MNSSTHTATANSGISVLPTAATPAPQADAKPALPPATEDIRDLVNYVNNKFDANLSADRLTSLSKFLSMAKAIDDTLAKARKIVAERGLALAQQAQTAAAKDPSLSNLLKDQAADYGNKLDRINAMQSASPFAQAAELLRNNTALYRNLFFQDLTEGKKTGFDHLAELAERYLVDLKYFEQHHDHSKFPRKAGIILASLTEALKNGISTHQGSAGTCAAEAIFGVKLRGEKTSEWLRIVIGLLESGFSPSAGKQLIRLPKDADVRLDEEDRCEIARLTQGAILNSFPRAPGQNYLSVEDKYQDRDGVMHETGMNSDQMKAALTALFGTPFTNMVTKKGVKHADAVRILKPGTLVSVAWPTEETPHAIVVVRWELDTAGKNYLIYRNHHHGDSDSDLSEPFQREYVNQASGTEKALADDILPKVLEYFVEESALEGQSKVDQASKPSFNWKQSLKDGLYFGALVSVAMVLKAAQFALQSFSRKQAEGPEARLPTQLNESPPKRAGTD